MNDLFLILQDEWAIRALLASSMVGVLCGVIGCFIVLRNMSMIGDALSHAILPGVVFAFMLFGYSILGFFSGAVIAGLLTAVAITWVQQNAKTKNDAAIGIIFTAMFSIGVMGISWISRNEGVHLDLKDFLFGNVLGVSDGDLYMTLGITIYVLLSVVIFYRYLFATTFQPVLAQTMGISVQTMHYYLMLLLSFAVVAALQTVGVILVVAMLITPASTALLLSNRLKWVLFLAGVIGLISSILGLILSIIVETTPGPAMAVTATAIYFLAVIFAPQKGLIIRAINKRKLNIKIRLEDTLKQSLKLHERGNLTLNALHERLGYGRRMFKKLTATLSQRGLLNIASQNVDLTKKGLVEATALVRAHRLWETYLVSEMGLNEKQIHEDAEKYEHLLTSDLLDEMDEHLGFPKTDPHGSPIPLKESLPLKSILLMKIGQIATIANQQIDETITSKLWQLGLLPGAKIELKSKEKEQIIIGIKDEKIKLPAHLAKQISIEV